MDSGAQHTVKAFDEDMGEIRGRISEMGSRAEIAVTDSMKALLESDTDLAKTTAKNDKLIDQINSDVEKLIVRTIALRAPMADDLRELVAAMKMSAVIERIGDYSKNIAKRVGRLDDEVLISTDGQLRRMGEIAAEMVHNAMEAYAKRDTDLAEAVCRRDDDVDQLYKNLFVDFVAHVAKHPDSANQIAHLLFVSKNLERIGDHATTCAEMIYFTQTGEHIGDSDKDRSEDEE